MTSPSKPVHALIDADILRYEIGAMAEGPDGPLPFHVAEDYLLQRIEGILRATDTSDFTLYLTNGPVFRHDIAVTKPYKGNRKKDKPFHFNNLTHYMYNQFDVEEADGLEADDLMSLTQTTDGDHTIICTRDKDLLQVPGWHYGWECGDQGERYPHHVTFEGRLWKEDNGKVRGEGYAFFCWQLLVGDQVDNIPGKPGIGDKKAWALLGNAEPTEMFDIVRKAYNDDELLSEQGALLWMVRETNDLGVPMIWELPEG